MDETAITVLLWGMIALFLGWTWVPALISGLGGSRYSNGGSDDPTILAPGADEADYAFWQAKLTNLGYDPLGTGWMKINYYGSSWRYQTEVRAFFSRSSQCYAFVQKQPRPLDVWWLTMFATCWTDGGLLLTSNAADEFAGEGEYIVQGRETDDLGQVEELHLAVRDKLIKEGKRTDRDHSLETLLNATRTHSGPAARYLGVRLGQSYLAAHFLIHFFVSLPTVILRSMDDWSLPFVNVVLGILLASGEYTAKKRAGTILREQMREKIERTTNPVQGSE